MHPRILDKSRRDAQERIDAAASTLAKRAGVDRNLVDALSAYHDRDPEANRLRQMEATATLLEALVEGGKAKTVKDEKPAPAPQPGKAPQTAPAARETASGAVTGRTPAKGK